MIPDATAPYLFVGLGNPGRKYRLNRHNIGFMVLDALAKEIGASFTRHQSQALITKGRLDGSRVVLAKPQTFMNLAGPSVAALARYYRVPPSSLVVVFDDLDLPPGKVRLRGAGSSGGHRGMESVIASIGEDAIPRLRLGIGRPPGRMDPADYVLEDFSADELEDIRSGVDRAVACLQEFVRNGVDRAMTKFNPSPE